MRVTWSGLQFRENIWGNVKERCEKCKAGSKKTSQGTAPNAMRNEDCLDPASVERMEGKDQLWVKLAGLESGWEKFNLTLQELSEYQRDEWTDVYNEYFDDIAGTMQAESQEYTF